MSDETSGAVPEVSGDAEAMPDATLTEGIEPAPGPGDPAPEPAEQALGPGEPTSELAEPTSELAEPTSSLERHGRLAEDTPRGGAFSRLVANSKFRRLWIAQFVSSVGDWLVIGLLIPLVTTLSGGSSFAVAGILIAKILPALLFSSLTGVIVDRFDRRWVMIAADTVRAVLTLFLLFTNSLAVIYLVVLLMETASLFFYPARNALIPYLLEDERDVVAANGLAYTTQQAAMLVGLTASGAIIAGFEVIVRDLLRADVPLVSRMVGVFAPALLGPRAGVFLNSLTFVFSAVVLLSITVSAKPPRCEERLDLSLLGRDVIDSFKFLGEHKELRSLLVTIFTAILGGGAIIPVGLVFVQQNLTGVLPLVDRVPELQRLAGAPETFMLVFLAVGMVAGALIAPRLEEHMSLQLMFAGSVTVFGAAMLVFAGIRQYWLACLLAIVAGVAVAMVTVAGNTYVVRTVDDASRGRVFTALESVVRVALLISMIVMAPIGDLFASVLRRIADATNALPPTVFLTGTRITLFLAGCIVLGAAVYAWRTLSWRRVSGPPAVEGAADV